MVQSSILGRLLYTFDRAAWVGTDALVAEMPKEQLPSNGGYVVEVSGPSTLKVTFYRGASGDAQSFFVADVSGGKVVRTERLPKPIALSAMQNILVRAREAALAAAGELSFRPCTAAPFNTVVLPPRDYSPVAVYLLTAQLDTKSYPVGGHYRILVRLDGGVAASRTYSKACLNMALPKPTTKSKSVSLFVSHLLDPAPTEIHVFVSMQLRMPIFVGTTAAGTKAMRLWAVQGGKISPIGVNK